MQITTENLQRPLFFPFRFMPAERKVFERKESLTPSEWAAKHRVVSIGAHKGPWRNDVSPHLVEIMNTWALPHVREVILCKSPQCGGSETINNCAAYALERDPSVMLFIMPSQADARKIAIDRLIPMIKSSPRLAELMSPNPDDTASQRIKFSNGALIHMAWSNSASALATFPVKYLFFDEVDKYPPTVGKETDPITLGEKRARTFRHTHKIFKVSTPTREDGPIWKAWLRADVQYKYHVACPDCGAEQTMQFSQLKYPADIKAEEIRRNHLARYECEACEAQWTDSDRDRAISTGIWQRHKGQGISRPRSVAYHLPSFISPDVSLSEIAEAYLRSKHSRAKLIDFYNDYLAEPFNEDLEGETVKEEVLYNRREKYAPEGAEWQIPIKACLLTCYVDVQKNRLELEVVAWGPGHESWGSEYRQIPGDPTKAQVWDDLDEFLLREWTHESGARLKIAICGIDSGFLAGEVYRFVRRRQGRRVYACKGSSTKGRALISIPSMRNLKRTIAKQQKVTQIIIGTETAKDAIFNWMQNEQPGPGYMHFPENYGFDYFRMLTAEKAIIKYDKAGRPYREWIKKHADARNEALDIRCGNYAVLELLNPNMEKISLGLLPKVAMNEEPTVTAPVPAKKKRSLLQKQGNGWISGWK